MKRRHFISQLSAGSLLMPMNFNTIQQVPKSTPFVIKKGGARNNMHMPFKGINPNDLKVSKNDSNGGFALFEYEGNEKTGPSFHIHLRQDEFFFVTEGDFKFKVGTELHDLSAGDCIFLPRNIPHTWLQISDHGRLIYLVSPAGSFENFFAEMTAFTSKPTMEQINRLHSKHQMKIVGPPMTLANL